MNQSSTTITNPQLKEGYKQTEVGVIPEDWSATNLGKFMMLQRGYDLPHRERRIGGIPIITSSGFGGTHSESRALAPGVVTGRYGTIGDVFYVQEDFWPLNTTLYVKNFYGNNPLFASYLLKTIDFHSHSGKSGVPGVNRNDLHELIVCIPPLLEQEAIACTLSDVDALIESLDRLLTKKRQIKQGAMQELLRSKDGWTGNQLGDLFNISAGSDLRKNEFSAEQDENHQFPIYSNAITEHGLYGYCSTKDYSGNCITITARGSTGHAVFRNNDFAAIGRLLILEPIGNTNCMFVAEYINLWINFANESTGVPQLTVPQASKYVVQLPEITKQIEIANILSDMDAEIGSISAKLTKIRQLKQGMMHELLTGRIRLVDKLK
jgi:type I restriction enzyme, S subunit